MSFSHEAIATNPVSGDVDKALQRALFTRRYTYNLGDDELASDFVAVDPATGILPLYLRQLNVTYKLDPNDGTTSAGAGVCLVTSDGKRYKSETIAYPHSVLDKDTTAQPASPSSGDRYLIPNAATGTDWSGKDGKIGIYVGSAWHFVTVPIGVFIYVEDETAFYHRNATGTWTAGPGSIVIGAGSVPITAVIGAKASFVIKVENQTTATAPASPVAPVAYIVAGSSGAWSGYSVGDLAICLVDGSWTRIVPATGDEIYDKALNGKYRWTGTQWVSDSGTWVDFPTPIQTAGTGSTTSSGSGAYTYSNTTAPGAFTRRSDDVGIIYTARRTNAWIRVRWTGNIITSDVGYFVVGLRRDTDVSCLDWHRVYIPVGSIETHTELTFLFQANNASPHTYTVLFYANGANTVTSLSRRTITLEGAA